MTLTRRSVVLGITLWLGLIGVPVAEAQDMALRFYVVPKIGTGATPTDAIRPKYIGDMGVPFGAMPYGLEDTFLVGADVTGAQHTTINGNIDVISIPQNLDAAIGLVALSTVKSRLESLHVPSDWVTQDHTYRDVVRITGKLFIYMQRFHAQQLRRFFESGVTLDTRVNQLTAAQRTAMSEAAQSLGLDTSVVTNTMELRQALRLIIQQIPAFSLKGQTF